MGRSRKRSLDPDRRGAGWVRALFVGLALFLLPGAAQAQRFGGQFGAGGGFWFIYAAADPDPARSFDRELGDLIMLGGRGFLQTGRVRLGGGGFGGSFTDEGVNPSGNSVTGGLSGGGFIVEYLAVQQNVEVAVGGMAGGGELTIEERISVVGDVETLNRRRETVFLGYPWVRVAYNLAPFVNAGLQVGYLVGSEDFSGFSVGIDVMAGLIP